MRSCNEGSADAIYTRYCNFVKVIVLPILLMTLSSKDHFNYLVTHNAMKWQPCERREGVFSYDDADGAVAWAKANKIPMRGHALLWATGDQTNNVQGLSGSTHNQLRLKAHRCPTGSTPTAALSLQKGYMLNKKGFATHSYFKLNTFTFTFYVTV